MTAVNALRRLLPDANTRDGDARLDGGARLSSATPPSRRAVARRLGSSLILIAGVAYLLAMLVRQSLTSMDFRYVWLAGDLWGRGKNPYGPDYIAAGAMRFPEGYAIAGWAYPFHWFVPAWAVAQLPPEVSFAWWLAITTLALAVTAWLAIAAARALALRPSTDWTLIAIGLAAAGSVVGYALRTGQPALVAEFGIALTLYGIARDRRRWIVAGLAVAMLKPQLGLPFAVAVCFLPGGLVTAIIAAIVVLAASIPAFLASGFDNQIRGLLAVGGGSYQAVSYNTADMMSGLPHIVALITDRSMSITVSMVLAAALAGAAAWAVRKRPDRERRIAVIVLTCVITSFVVGLHTYDLMAVGFVMPFLSTLPAIARAAAIAGFVLLWRTGDLVHAVGQSALMPTVQSIALLAILTAYCFVGAKPAIRAGEQAA